MFRIFLSGRLQIKEGDQWNEVRFSLVIVIRSPSNGLYCALKRQRFTPLMPGFMNLG